jgi:TRAP-type C4-dicarboxylate transport system substrate-binding protein
VLKLFIKVVSLALFSVSVSAVTLKISTAYPDGTSILNTFRAAADEIERDTQGRVKMRFYPGGVMGDDQAVLRKVRIGQLHGAIIQTGLFADVYRDSQIYNAPMLFRDFDEVDYIRSKFDQTIIDGYEAGGWNTFGLMEGGFAYLVSVNPVITREDLKAQKFWIPANDAVSENISKAFGVSPIVLGYGEVKTSLETGAINALASPPIATISMQWFTKVRYVTDQPFLYTAATLAIDNKVFNKISPEDQLIVSQYLGGASKALDKQNRLDNIKAYAALLNQGLEVVAMSDSERSRLLADSQMAAEKLVEMGQYSQEVYDLVNGWLIEYRAR